MQFFSDDFNVTLNATDPRLANLANVVFAMRTYYRPSLTLFGILGNATSVANFSSGRFKKHCSAPFLQALALSDTLFLVVLQVVFVSDSKFDLYNSPGWCQVLTYASYVSTFIPVWIYVAFGIDRCLFVTCRDNYSKWCSPLRSKLVVCSLLVVAIVVYLNISILSGVTRNFNNDTTCSPLPRFMREMVILDKVDAIVNVLVPYSLLCISGVVIGVFYYWYQKMASSHQIHLRMNPHPLPRWGIIERELVVVCLVLTVTFYVFNLPSALLRLSMFVASLQTGDLHMGNYTVLWQQVFLHMYFSRFAINCAIYLACSSAFRSNCVALLCPRCLPKEENKKVAKLYRDDKADTRVSCESIHATINSQDASQVSSV